MKTLLSITHPQILLGTQLYLSFETSSTENLSIRKSTIENCVKDIDLRVPANKVKLNSNKTEILVFSSPYCPRPALNNLVIASEAVDCSTTAKPSMSMLPHVTAVCKSSFFYLRNIFKIRKFLSYDTCKILIHAFVTSRIDYCNLLLYIWSAKMHVFYIVCEVSLLMLQGSFILAVYMNMSFLCLSSFIGFMVLHLTKSLSSLSLIHLVEPYDLKQIAAFYT